MIDSHCHLDHSPLYENLNDILSRSKDIGIEKLLTISTAEGVPPEASLGGSLGPKLQLLSPVND